MNKKHIALFLLSFAASAALSSPICDDLAARQSAFFSEGGMIPIAYLESTGTQWIDLDLNSTADRFCELTADIYAADNDDTEVEARRGFSIVWNANGAWRVEVKRGRVTRLA